MLVPSCSTGASMQMEAGSGRWCNMVAPVSGPAAHTGEKTGKMMWVSLKFFIFNSQFF